MGALSIAGCAADIGTSGSQAQDPAGVGAAKVAQPGASDGNRVRRLHGMLATGSTPYAAAESYRRGQSTAALGVDADDLKLVGRQSGGRNRRVMQSGPASSHGTATGDTDGVGLMYDRATGKYKFRLFTYEQERDGIPVFDGGLRTLVRADGDNPVVWVSANVRPMGDFRATAAATLAPADLEKSLQALRGHRASRGVPLPTALTLLGAPTPTVFGGVGAEAEAPRMAMQYIAQDADGPGKWTFVADATTGDILHVRSNVHANVSGTVKAKLIVGDESMECGTLGTAPLPYANVTSAIGNAVADQTGAFAIPDSGSGSVNVTSALAGRYFYVTDNSGSIQPLSQTVSRPGTVDFVHEDTAVPPARVLAGLNAYKQANEIRDMLLAYVPDYPIIADQTDFEIVVNHTDMRGCALIAWYDDERNPRSLHFCEALGDYANTAFGSIVHHEYGHHIVDSGASRQGEYGEGMGDVIAMLFAKDPRMAVGIHPNQCDQPLRNADNTCQYSSTSCSSCGAEIHECGMLISGTIWDIWKELDLTDPAHAQDIIRSLVLSSIPLHEGTSINAGIAVDLLTLDDDDGLLENGTPHYQEICTGFSRHGMSCPPIITGLVVKPTGTDLASQGPSRGPFDPRQASYTLYNLGTQALTYAVRNPSSASWLVVDSSTGTLAPGAHTTVTVSIDQARAALLADGDYSANIDFVNQTTGVTAASRTMKLRVAPPVPIYTATFTSGLDGFTVDSELENLWHRSVACMDGDAGHTSSGTLYYGEDLTCDYTTPVPVKHTVASPTITIANPGVVELGFNYYLDTEDVQGADSAAVLVSVDGGAFRVVASNNEGGQELKETRRTWQPLRFDITSLLPATRPTRIQIQLSFNAGNTSNNARRGFALDDITVYARPVTARPCASYCANPTTFTIKDNYQSGNLGTNSTCRETLSPVHGGVCGNFASPRKLFVNGVEMRCNWAPWSTIPAAKDGGYCIYTTSGNYPWAAFTVW